MLVTTLHYYYLVCDKSQIGRNCLPSGTDKLTLFFCQVRFAQSSGFRVLLCGSLFVQLSLACWSLCYYLFFYLRLLITISLVSSNFSHITIYYIHQYNHQGIVYSFTFIHVYFVDCQLHICYLFVLIKYLKGYTQGTIVLNNANYIYY